MRADAPPRGRETPARLVATGAASRRSRKVPAVSQRMQLQRVLMMPAHRWRAAMNADPSLRAHECLHGALARRIGCGIAGRRRTNHRLRNLRFQRDGDAPLSGRPCFPCEDEVHHVLRCNGLHGLSHTRQCIRSDLLHAQIECAGKSLSSPLDSGHDFLDVSASRHPPFVTRTMRPLARPAATDAMSIICRTGTRADVGKATGNAVKRALYCEVGRHAAAFRAAAISSFRSAAFTCPPVAFSIASASLAEQRMAFSTS